MPPHAGDVGRTLTPALPDGGSAARSGSGTDTTAETTVVTAPTGVQRPGGHLLHPSIVGAGGAQVVVPADPLLLLRAQ